MDKETQLNSSSPLSKDDLIFRDRDNKNYHLDIVAERRKWISNRTNADLAPIGTHTLDTVKLEGNIENLIGSAQVPLGVAGPLLINGDFAKGKFYVPFATTEGALVESYERGMVVLTRSGGANTKILGESMHITPIFKLDNLAGTHQLVTWVNNNFSLIKEVAEQSTSHGKLLEIKTYIMGKWVLLCFVFHTGDAMGLNMVNIATDNACRFITEKIHASYFLRSNLSSDKKPAFFPFILGYGKEVTVECLLPRKIVSRYLRVSPEQMYDFWHCSIFGSLQSGAIGLNAHYANALAAIFIACGQDVAQVVNAASGISMGEVTKDGDFYASLRLPCIVIGTVGGGTGLPTQRACLEMLGCFGTGNSNKFAEIIAGTLLAGELSLCAALASGDFIERHKLKHKHLKNQVERSEDKQKPLN